MNTRHKIVVNAKNIYEENNHMKILIFDFLVGQAEITMKRGKRLTATNRIFTKEAFKKTKRPCKY